jgi:ubiquinol-cytochrome c reductase cytochrome c subunit
MINVLAMILAVAAAQAPAGNAVKGKAVFTKAGCYACHGAMGQGGPGGRIAPMTMQQPIFMNDVRNGKANPNADRNWSGMPPFSAKFLSDTELADIYAYLTSIPAPAKNIPLLNQ